MEQRNHLVLLPSKDAFHPKIQRSIDNIVRCIIDLVVRYKGQVSLKRVESHTGLKNVSLNWTADIVRYMAKEGIIEIRGTSIVGSVAKLTEIIEQAKTSLPKKHEKLWSENDYIKLSELQLDDRKKSAIAKLMGRTEHSINIQSTILRKAYRLIPIIERNKVVRDFASKPKSPNPKK